MSFISLEFFVFLASLIVIFYLSPIGQRWLILLAASGLFCLTLSVQSLAVLVVSIVGNYFFAQGIARAQRKQRLLYLSIGFNLALIILFRFTLPITQALHMNPLLLIVPIGVSYYTFIQMGYNADVYHGRFPPETQLGQYALFVSFFPHIVSGPIDRANKLLPQLRSKAQIEPASIVEGLRLILLGAVKKLVIGDRLGQVVATVYGDPRSQTSLGLLIATGLFAFQIYADFSGYTDMVRGIAKLFGIDLAINFRQPYFSRSVREFWERWHISLSTWIREYLFFPISRRGLRLSGGKFSEAVQFLVSLLVMGLVGLWHGTGFTFLVWGLLHGFYLGAEALFRKARWARASESKRAMSPAPLRAAFQIGLTFGLVNLAWIFFRASSFSDAVYIVARIMNLPAYRAGLSIGREKLFSAAVLVIAIVLIDAIEARWGLFKLLERIPRPVRWGIYYAVLLIILLLSAENRPTFIYARF